MLHDDDAMELKIQREKKEAFIISLKGLSETQKHIRASITMYKVAQGRFEDVPMRRGPNEQAPIEHKENGRNEASLQILPEHTHTGGEGDREKR